MSVDAALGSQVQPSWCLHAHSAFADFVARNDELCSALCNNYVAHGGINAYAPHTLLQVNDAIKRVLALLPEPTVEQLERLNVLTDLRLRAIAVRDDFTEELRSDMRAMTFMYNLVWSIRMADEVFGKEWMWRGRTL